jgi:hypothetical protein
MYATRRHEFAPKRVFKKLPSGAVTQASFTRKGKKMDLFFCIRPIFCPYPEKIGRIEIGKFLSVRPSFLSVRKIGRPQKIGQMQKSGSGFCLFV